LPYTCVRMVSCQVMWCENFTRVIVEGEQDYDAGVDRINEMLEAIQAEVT
jgi:hypothetical protein